MGKSILREKSYLFAIEIINLYKYMEGVKKEYVMSKQLLKSGTSIGANIREAEFAQSKKDFINKLSIALKEANETLYWLELLNDTQYLKNENFKRNHDYCKEITAMLVSSIKTSKSG